MFNILALSDDAQATLFVIIAENALKFSNEIKTHEISNNALRMCWQWIESKQSSGDELYELIDSGKNYDLVDFQEDIDDEREVDILNCIINAVIYTCKKAYDLNNEYLPQAVESANESLYEHSKNILLNLDDNLASKLHGLENYFSNTQHFKSQEITRSNFVEYL